MIVNSVMLLKSLMISITTLASSGLIGVQSIAWCLCIVSHGCTPSAAQPEPSHPVS
jgi:hypothetical protein